MWGAFRKPVFATILFSIVIIFQNCGERSSTVTPNTYSAPEKIDPSLDSTAINPYSKYVQEIAANYKKYKEQNNIEYRELAYDQSRGWVNPRLINECPGIYTQETDKGHELRYYNPEGTCTISGFVFHSKNGAYALRIDHNTTGTVTIVNNFFTGNGGWSNGSFYSKATDFEEADTLSESFGYGIFVDKSSNVIIDNNHFRDTAFAALRVEGDPLAEEHSIKFRKNIIQNMQRVNWVDSGAYWTYQAYAISYMFVNGLGHEISDNRIINEPGKSFQTDVINTYMVAGTQASPFKLEYNVYIGGGAEGYYNFWGAGMQIGDHTPNQLGGEHLVVKNNLLLASGAVGFNVNSGVNVRVESNIVYNDQDMRGWDPLANVWGTGREIPEIPAPEDGGWTTYFSHAVYDFSVVSTYKVDEGVDLSSMYNGIYFARNYSHCPKCMYRLKETIKDYMTVVDEDNTFEEDSFIENSIDAMVSKEVLSDQSCVATTVSWGTPEECYGAIKQKASGDYREVKSISAKQGTALFSCYQGRWYHYSSTCN